MDMFAQNGTIWARIYSKWLNTGNEQNSLRRWFHTYQFFLERPSGLRVRRFWKLPIFALRSLCEPSGTTPLLKEEIQVVPLSRHWHQKAIFNRPLTGCNFATTEPILEIFSVAKSTWLELSISADHKLRSDHKSLLIVVTATTIFRICDNNVDVIESYNESRQLVTSLGLT